MFSLFRRNYPAEVHARFPGPPPSETPLFDATVLATGITPRERVSSLAYPDYPNTDPFASPGDLGRMARLDVLADLASPLTAEVSA